MHQKGSKVHLWAWISELENRSIEIIQAEEEEKKGKAAKFQRNVNTTKHTNIWIMWISEVEERETEKNKEMLARTSKLCGRTTLYKSRNLNRLQER